MINDHDLTIFLENASLNFDYYQNLFIITFNEFIKFFC